MTDRDKMIEVMLGMGVMIPGSGKSYSQDCADITDRLIAAGFGLFERSGVYRWSGGFKADDDAVIENGDVLYRRKDE